MKIGINSSALKKFENNTLKSILDELDVVELSLANIDFLVEEDRVVQDALDLKESFNVEYCVHAPYQNSLVERTRIDLASLNGINIRLMEKVISISHNIGADPIVVHGGDYCHAKSLCNVITNLRQVCKVAQDYGINIVIENMFTNELNFTRIGEKPEDLVEIVEKVGMDNLGVNVDVGHAFVSSCMYDLEIIDYFRVLRDYICHLNVHNNYGVWKKPWDSHLPLFNGLIDYGKLMEHLKAEKMILEVKEGSLRDIYNSINFLRGKSVKLNEDQRHYLLELVSEQ
ncbi:MAG: sugar phosphate isomerase/epimerase family protein [Archaeoglobaceae archaeon]